MGFIKINTVVYDLIKLAGYEDDELNKIACSAKCRSQYISVE